MKNLTESYKNILIPIIIRYLPYCKIVLYGSRARGDFKEGSDIDVALNAGDNISDLLMGKIMEDLEESNLPIRYDIVDFWNISKDMQQKIIKEGVVWKQ